MSTALKNGATTLNSHSYVYNNGSQRTKQTLTDSSYVDYAYDNLGQLDTALTKTSGGTAVSGQQFDYGYDAGWNMTSRATGTGTSAYTVNDRNQATAVAGYAQSYSALGNRTQEMTGTTSSFDYLYDAENQLISVATDTYGTPDASRWKMEFVYDGRGRMRIRKDYIWLSGAWYPNGEQRYVYDGMRLLQQRSSSNVPQVSYTRGLDLSGSLEGAGGIGGLLARSTHATISPHALNSTAYYHADGNGNITYLLRSDAAANASYKYDPFGRLLSSSGSLAAINVMRFSSKPILLSSQGTWGDYYYGYRFYDPESQRWLNRDPIGERGGINLYGFVFNNPANWIDTDGRAIMPPMPPRMPPPDTVIQKCNRKIENDENDFIIGLANTRGHDYFSWPDPNGGTDGVGFRDPNGQDGDLPQSEAGSKARSCRPCYKSNSPLKYGKGAGKPGTSASNDDITDCLKNRPIKGNYHGTKNNCNDWAKGAEKDCGLFCP